jgi:2-iminobutanoate/2-iminopropanoate deaminase
VSARRSVTSDEAPSPSGGYSQGIQAGDFLFLAGQGPFAADGTLVDGSIEAQVRQVFANLDAVARAAGGSLAGAVRVGVYLSSLDHFDSMDAVYRTLFSDPLPARTTTESELGGFDVEADAIIYLS